MRNRRIISLAFLLLLTAGAFLAFRVYQMIQGPNVEVTASNKNLLIPSGSTFEDLQNILAEKSILINPKSFTQVAKWMKFGDRVHSGQYELSSGLSNRSLINLLRSGNQKPIKLTINNVRMLTDLSSRISEQLEVDSTGLLTFLQSSKAHQIFNTTPENVLTYFIPETYQIFWNTDPEQLAKRMLQEHRSFWDKNDRLEKAQVLDMTPEEVYTLASIVEKETLQKDEQAIVAGLYLNRIDKGILLQADPTVVYANQEFGLRRVLNKHLRFESPYNTYLNAGLPPGPICMPSISSIDAVLNRAEHDYLYMCARPDSSGRHAFASSLREHNRNAQRYRSWLNQRGIR